MKAILMSAALACLVASALAFAQTQPPKPTGSTMQAKPAAMATTDKNFIMNAAHGGMMEVELGRMATEKASHADVKQFGQRMVDDHGKANDELKSLASQKNITLPTDLDAPHKAMRDRLAKLSGEAFDRAYMRDMVTDHTKDVAEFERAAKTARDAEVKAWAAKTLPTLEAHLKLAKEVNAKVTPPKETTKKR